MKYFDKRLVTKKYDFYQVSGVIIIGLFMMMGLFQAYQIAWLSDDGYLSMRYAENFSNGIGLVFNSGEYVEGYTNFLWTLLLASLNYVGFSIEVTAKYFGLLPHCLLVCYLIYLTWQRNRYHNTHLIPIAAIYILLSNDFQVWATGGLETSLFTALALIGIQQTRSVNYRCYNLLLTGCIFSLLVLTRMDGILFVIVGVLSYLLPNKDINNKRKIQNILIVISPVVLTLVIWLSFKKYYYGDFFPTAFYSKSVVENYISQGFIYVGIFFLKNWILLLMLGFSIVIAGMKKVDVSEYNLDIYIYLFAGGLYTAYLIYVGGDFMFARRFIPVVPFILVVLEIFIVKIKDLNFSLILSIIFLIGGLKPYSFYSDGIGRIYGIADEPKFYTEEIMRGRKIQAAILKEVFEDMNPRVVIDGGLLGLVYYSKLPYVVEATGLTQYSIAKQTIEERSQIGHEKTVTREWLEKNKIHFRIMNLHLSMVRSGSTVGLNEMILYDTVKLEILMYSDDIMDKLKNKPGILFYSIDQVIDWTKKSMLNADLTQAQILFNKLDSYYFKNAEGKRQQEYSELRDILQSKREGI